ncbi:MAG: carboxypeptidase-like regulatory domain-containing protein, partial [Coriobacteriia bacterium]|nr:carboxypeptidase-like regulatory domain-containing protein [Coriobacteriia bacterium]
SKISFVAGYTGDYYALVAGYGGGATGSYGLNLSLSGGISGTVIDGIGDPVDTVEVYAYEYSAGDSWQVGSASTQSDGTYEILGLDAGTYRIEFVDHNGQYAGEFYDDASTMDLATDIVVYNQQMTTGTHSDLGLAGHITGRISNSSNMGLGEIGVQAYSYFPDWGWEWVWDTTSGPDGLYDVPGLRTGNYRLGFSDESGNYLGEYYDNATDLETATDIAVTVGSTTSGKNAVLARAGHITGRIANSSNAGLEDIEVRAYSYSKDWGWDWAWSSTSDPDGLYDIAGLPTGTYRIGFEDYNGNYLGEYYDNATSLEAATNIGVTAGATTSGKNAVLAAAGHIAGTVTGPSGEPLGEIDVQVFKYDVFEGYWDWAGSGGTDFDGTYDVGGLRTGTYRVGFEDYNSVFAPEYYNNVGTVEAATDVAVTAGSTRTINAALALAGHITGRVTSAGGGPIEGIGVTAYRTSTWGWDWVT